MASANRLPPKPPHSPDRWAPCAPSYHHFPPGRSDSPARPAPGRRLLGSDVLPRQGRAAGSRAVSPSSGVRGSSVTTQLFRAWPASTCCCPVRGSGTPHCPPGPAPGCAASPALGRLGRWAPWSLTETAAALGIL